MSVTPAVQYVLPAIHCAAKDGSGNLTIECRIQKSRRPRIDNVIGIWSPTVTYNATFVSGVQTVGDVVYSGSSYPGWRCIQTNVNHAPPTSMADWWASGSAYWEPASNFDFVQGDFTKVFYLDQQIIKKEGLGSFVRSVSRQQGLITPDSRQFQFLDYSEYSGAWGVTTTPYVVGSNIGATDLSATDYRTLLCLIFDDPDAFYTVFFSRVTGQGYDTNRELYNIGDIDFAKLTAEYDLDWMPGTSEALQKLSGKVQAEAVLNRLNTFSVYDLLCTIGRADLDAFGEAQCFIGGSALLGSGPPPTFPQFGNRYYLAGYTNTSNQIAGISVTVGPVTTFTPYPIRYHHSRADSRVAGISLNGSTLTNTDLLQNALVVASTSINDGLHFIKLTTILAKVAELMNFSWNSTTDLVSKLSFWSDIVDQTYGTLSAANVALADIGVCYEYFFNVDFRCGPTITGTDTAAADYPLAISEMKMTGGNAWTATLGDMKMRLARALITFVKSGYDQTNWRPENTLTDSITPSANPLPNWETSKGGIKPRVQSALYVAVSHTGDSDVSTCPRVRQTSPLKVEMALRVKKQGLLNTTVGDSTIDIIQNSKLVPADQWKTFSPMTGGIFDGGHVVGRNHVPGFDLYEWSGTIAPSSLPAGLPTGSGGAGGTGYGLCLTLTDTSKEFVLVQGAHGNLWSATTDIYGNGANYLYGNCPGFGLSDSVCFANGSYAAVLDKNTRNQLWIMYPHELPTGVPGGPAPPTNSASSLPYVIGYNAFGVDLAVCVSRTNQTPTAAGVSSIYVTSTAVDFYNNDCHGNGYIGQQIIIPARGIFTIKQIWKNGSDNTHTSGNFLAIFELDRPVNSGTDLEFRIGGPNLNSDSFMIGTYFYYYNTADLRFGSAYYNADIHDGTVNGFLPSMFLNAATDSSTGASGWEGCYALSRLRYADGTVYDGSTMPDDSYGTALKTFAQCQAALNLGSFQLVTRNFAGVLSVTSPSMLGYGPLDTYSEWSQGAQQNYKVQTLAINERAGVIAAELLSTTNALPIDDINYPVTNSSDGSSGGGGGSSGAGASSGGGGASSGLTWAANPGAVTLTVGANVDVSVTGITELVLSAIGGASSISGFFDPAKAARAGLTVINHTGYNVTLNNEDSASLLQIDTITGVDLTIPNGGNVTLIYDATVSMWQVTGFAAAPIGETIAAISADQNDWPLNPSNQKIFRISATTPVNVYGIAGGSAWMVIYLVNVGSFPITLVSDDGSHSTAANRFLFDSTGDSTRTLLADDSICVWYDSTTQRWRNFNSGG